MDQFFLDVAAVEHEEVVAESIKKLSELELTLIGGGIGDTIL